MLSIKLPRRLRAVPDLGPYEIHVGALVEHHVGLTVVLRKRLSDGRSNLLTGPLRYVPTAAKVKPLLVVQIGDYSTGLHPSSTVMVIPNGYKATVTVAPTTLPEGDQP
ncbi:hypothetical protein A5742_09965 [Mycolicibacterium fortuitum]|uniref:Uncharacterized protein n=1 Tax=Mycolicibacterium fortuitum TaxID=1766 RepID=A0ABD6QG28_MYCFO|nr:hypothetical protein [Mycolicibacterium fortuitum]OMC37262.1 hypothetical protein A5742_09965 [Mycolicibacterium fortuitum]